jgi:hypothetical protein
MEKGCVPLLYWRIRKRAAVESIERMADIDISTEATEKGWRRSYGKRAGVEVTGKGLILVNLCYDGYAQNAYLLCSWLAVG